MSEYKSFNFLVYINIAVYNNIVINITGKNQNADKNSPKLLNVRIFVIEITKLPIVVFSPAKIPKLIKKFLKSKNETEYITNGKYNAFIFFFKNSPQSFSSFLYKKPEQKKKIANDINTQMDRLEYLYYQLVYSSLHVL